jgi:hypothetical protein
MLGCLLILGRSPGGDSRSVALMQAPSPSDCPSVRFTYIDAARCLFAVTQQDGSVTLAVMKPLYFLILSLFLLAARPSTPRIRADAACGTNRSHECAFYHHCCCMSDLLRTLRALCQAVATGTIPRCCHTVCHGPADAHPPCGETQRALGTLAQVPALVVEPLGTGLRDPA